ncbi:DUF3304 domain-containing protein [Lysobacter capsici]|uniref:DUF3304 domain-containing protein n=1 Tax=Lysobacter capsici TaxID=435897 RepID=UPI00287BB630|nr:DUF3304 domain-containing protein [Lysobacter capsici]WND83060.1 DUF3304 domain-containing protein [Lysobacter capsici]WND88259.1 DUF3304 domain-containing protein [Lysobacter capsici]
MKNSVRWPCQKQRSQLMRAALILLVGLAFTGCGYADPRHAQAKAAGGEDIAPSSEATANLSAYNHTPNYIHEYSVNGQFGANAYAYSGGSSFVCCIVYPRTWTSGLKAVVRWSTSNSDPKGPLNKKWHEKLVPIDRYDRTGTTMNVHFLSGDQVRLVISNGDAYRPDYPGPPGPVKPPGFRF